MADRARSRRLEGLLLFIELSGLEVSLVNVMSRELVLREYLNQIMEEGEYDYCLIDCMPSLGMLTMNALAAADEVIIPSQMAFLPVKGLQQLIKTVYKVKRQINPKLVIMNGVNKALEIRETGAILFVGDDNKLSATIGHAEDTLAPIGAMIGLFGLGSNNMKIKVQVNPIFDFYKSFGID